MRFLFSDHQMQLESIEVSVFTDYHPSHRAIASVEELGESTLAGGVIGDFGNFVKAALLAHVYLFL